MNALPIIRQFKAIFAEQSSKYEMSQRTVNVITFRPFKSKTQFYWMVGRTFEKIVLPDDAAPIDVLGIIQSITYDLDRIRYRRTVYKAVVKQKSVKWSDNYPSIEMPIQAFLIRQSCREFNQLYRLITENLAPDCVVSPLDFRSDRVISGSTKFLMHDPELSREYYLILRKLVKAGKIMIEPDYSSLLGRVLVKQKKRIGKGWKTVLTIYNDKK